MTIKILLIFKCNILLAILTCMLELGEEDFRNHWAEYEADCKIDKKRLEELIARKQRFVYERKASLLQEKSEMQSKLAKIEQRCQEIETTSSEQVFFQLNIFLCFYFIFFSQLNNFLWQLNSIDVLIENEVMEMKYLREKIKHTKANVNYLEKEAAKVNEVLKSLMNAKV